MKMGRMLRSSSFTGKVSLKIAQSHCVEPRTEARIAFVRSKPPALIVEEEANEILYGILRIRAFDLRPFF